MLEAGEKQVERRLDIIRKEVVEPARTVQLMGGGEYKYKKFGTTAFSQKVIGSNGTLVPLTDIITPVSSATMPRIICEN
jgi:hypothetical protein